MKNKMKTGEKIISGIDRAIGAFETAFLTVALGGMAVALFAQVAAGAAGYSLAWVNETAMYLMAWTMFVGASAATRGRRHIVIGLFADRLRGRPARALRIAVTAICVTFCAAAFKLGVDYAIMSHALGQRSVALGAPLWIVYSALPLAAVLAAARFALLIFEKEETE